MNSQQKGISDKDVEKIRQIIIKYKSRSSTPFGRRVMIYMLLKSHILTIPVGINFPNKFNEMGKEATNTVHFIKPLRSISNTEFGFYSCYVPNLQKRNNGQFCYLSPYYHPNDKRIKVLKLNPETINQINQIPLN